MRQIIETPMVDVNRVPAHLVVLRIWNPDAASTDRGAIAYAFERKRRQAGAVLIVALFLMLLGGLLFHVPALATVVFLAALLGAGYCFGGSTGFYEINDDGSLGEYLGRMASLKGMHARRPTANRNPRQRQDAR